MSKESVIIKLGRVLYPRTVSFSKWQVGRAVQIPIHRELVPIPLRSPAKSERSNQVCRSRRVLFSALLGLAFGLVAGLSARASQSVSLAWNPSTDTSTAGYMVYAGNSPTSLTSQINVGTNTTVTISGLKEGTTNYFAVSAYNSASVVGAQSAPVSYIVPGLLMIAPTQNLNQPPVIKFPTAPGHWYEVQASTNLITWSNLIQTATATTNGWITCTDPNGLLPKRFYRLVMH